MKNSAKIRDGLVAMYDRPYEITGGKVVSGSVDGDQFIVTVQPYNDSAPIARVRLSSVTNNANGVMLIPKDESHVVIASIDGPGEWTIIKAGDLEKMTVNIGATKFTVTDGAVEAEDGNGARMVMSNGKFSLKNGSADFKTTIDNLLQHILALTVPTGTGPSGTPVNTPDFITDKVDFDNLFF